MSESESIFTAMNGVVDEDFSTIAQRVWWLCSTTGEPAEGNRLHTRIEGRYITIFRHHGVLSAIDAICHHAGGPLTQGGVQDIEDLGMSVVSCPWCVNAGVGVV
jgi:nitrite reductase/ring-hydroxylating ferredoxin subunit